MSKNKEIRLTFSGCELQNIDIYGTSVDSVEVLADREDLLEQLGYREDLLEQLEYREGIRIRNLEDEIKYDLILENFNKVPLKDLQEFLSIYK